MKLQHSDKLSRKVIFEKLMALKASGASLSDYDLDAMLMYFAPPVPKTPKNAFDWVAKAVANDSDVRTYLRYVYVSAGEMVATDGHRMHRAKIDMPDGFYEPKTGLPIAIDAKYPDYKRIIPKPATLSPAPEPSNPLVQGRIFFRKIGPVSINVDYLNAAGGAVEFFGDTLVTGVNVFGDFIILGMRTK